MKKFLNYLIFRIYSFYVDSGIELQIPLFYTSIAVSILLGLNIFSLAIFFQLKLVNDIIPSILTLFGLLLIIWILIYFGLVHPKKFMKKNFKKDTKGTISIVIYFVFTTFFFIIVSNENRARIAQNKTQINIDTLHNSDKKGSLEGEVRKWFNENF